MAERQGIEPYGETPWRKALTGGSDDHSGLFAASAYTEAGGDGTPQGFLRAVAAGDCDPGGEDGDARAAGAQHLRRLVLADPRDPAPGRARSAQKRALGLLRKGFGRIGRDVPVLEKTVRGVRSMAPGLYRDGDRRGPAWEELLEREIGSLLATPDGINAVGARSSTGASSSWRSASPATSWACTCSRCSTRGVAPGPQAPAAEPVRRRHGRTSSSSPTSSPGASRAGTALQQEQLRVYFLGERRHTRPEKIAVLCGVAGDGRRGRGATRPPGRRTPAPTPGRTSTST